MAARSNTAPSKKSGQLPQIAVKLEPWGDGGSKGGGVEAFPQVAGACGDKDDDPCLSCSARGDGPASPMERAPVAAKKMGLAARDKESLLEEIIELKRALADQAYHLKLHKVHAASVQMENRKLEKDIEQLEQQGNLEAPRTGGPSCLRAKLQGLKGRLLELQSICETQHDELVLLRRDFRVSRTHEVEVERDVFAGEIGRLQKVLRRLRALHSRISSENREIVRLREKIYRVECSNQRLENCISVIHQTVDRANKDITAVRSKAGEATAEAKKHGKKVKELQEHSDLLEGLLERERVEKSRMEKRIRFLEEEIRRLEREKAAAKQKALLEGAAARAQARKGKKGKKGKKGDKDSKDQDGKDKDGKDGKDSGKDGKDGKEVGNEDGKGGKLDDESEDGSERSSKGGKGSSPSSGDGSGRSDTASPGSGTSDSRSGRGTPDSSAAFLHAQEEYLEKVGAATEKFVESVPASQPSSPKSKSKSDKSEKPKSPAEEEKSHSQLEKEKETFTEKIDRAEKSFLETMEELEYGSVGSDKKSKSKQGKLSAEQQEALQKEQQAAEAARRTAETAKQAAELEAKKAQDDARRLAAELAALKAKQAADEASRNSGGSGGKRWATEKMIIQVGDEQLVAGDYTSEVQDKGSEIAIRVQIKSSLGSQASKDAARVKAGEDSGKNAGKTAAEAESKQRAEEEAKRKKADADEAARRQGSFDEHKKRMAAELEEAKRRAAEEEAKRKAAEASSSGEFFDRDMQGVIKTNIKEVLEHLENISEVVQAKSEGGDGDVAKDQKDAAKDVLQKLD